MNIKYLCVASGIILLLAINPTWPYGYYILLRWAVFLASIIVAVGFYKSKITGWAFVFAAIAYLFNPIFPVYITRQIWTPIDLICAVLFFIAGFSVKKK
jgi:hypothetical protein